MSIPPHRRHTTDTLTVLSVALVSEDINGVLTPLDLTAAIAGDLEFKMINKANNKIIIPLTATGVSFTASDEGYAEYAFSTVSTLKPGIYYGYFVYNDPDAPNHYPFNTGELVIEIYSDTQTAQSAYQEAVLKGYKTTIESEIISTFPEQLIIGDSYTANTGQIKLNITDGNGYPITGLGNLDFADADIEFTAYRPNDSAIIYGTCEFVDDTTETYILLTLPVTETIKGKAEYTYEGRLKFFWIGPSSSDLTDEEQKTYKTTPFKFVSNT